MTTRILKLCATFVITVLVATVLVFIMLRVLPGDPATVALGIDATPAQLVAWRASHGLNEPLVTQYLQWTGGLFRGDFGDSYVTGQNISPTIIDRAEVTLILVSLAMLLAIVIAVPLGMLAAVRHRHLSGVVISGVSQLGVALPSFLVGMLLIVFFAIELKWFPSGGWAPPKTGVQFLRYITLPVISLATVQASILTRYVRSAVLEIQGEDFLRTARSKGLTAMAALIRHGLRNAGIPVMTVIGVQLAGLLIGAVVVERVFAIPGIGSFLIDSVGNRDLLAVQGIVFLLVLAVIAINFLVDIAFTCIDPRLRSAS